MLNWFSRRSASRRRATDLYGAVVAMAREPRLFRDMGAADSPEGRYEVLVLQLFLVMERLKSEGEAGSELSRDLVETFVTDMDDNMREMGVGDLTVPRKVKKAAAAFYDRAEAYRAALAGDAAGAALEEALRAAIPAAEGRDLDAGRLAEAVRTRQRALAAQPAEAVFAGNFGPF